MTRLKTKRVGLAADAFAKTSSRKNITRKDTANPETPPEHIRDAFHFWSRRIDRALAAGLDPFPLVEIVASSIMDEWVVTP